MSYAKFEITRRKVNKRTATIKVVELYYVDNVIEPENLRRGDMTTTTVRVLFPFNLKKAVARKHRSIIKQLNTTEVSYHETERRSVIQEGGTRS